MNDAALRLVALPDLLPCPFCGTPPEFVEDGRRGHFGVRCVMCDTFQDSMSDTPTEAAQFWNMRR